MKNVMKSPVIGFVGMTHLGLVSAVASAEYVDKVVGFDADSNLVQQLKAGVFPIEEPGLGLLFQKLHDTQLFFSSDPTDLFECDVVYVAPDIPTDDSGASDLAILHELIDMAFKFSRSDAVIILLSQVPPGFSRSFADCGRPFYYQVETLVFGRALDRALYPERFIVGCNDPSDNLPESMSNFLKRFGCPILQMRYESAELAKTAINMFLVSSVSTANFLAELCEAIGADWSEIIPSLRLDKRIGMDAYISAGLGISGGNLERDISTLSRLGVSKGVGTGLLDSWLELSVRRKGWVAEKVRQVLRGHTTNARVAVLGLSYKENTHSTKNSPALRVLRELADFDISVYDPVVSWNRSWHSKALVARSVRAACEAADVLAIVTPWPEFKKIKMAQLSCWMRGRQIIDPFGLVDIEDAFEYGFTLHRLGVSSATTI